MGKRKAKAKTDAQLTEPSKQQQQPKIADRPVTESDDEEIPEDEAFNSEDERMYGHFFNKKKGSEESEVSSDEGSDDADDDDDDIDDDDDDDDENDVDDGGQYMLNLLEKLDTVQTKRDSSSLSQMTHLPESEFS